MIELELSDEIVERFLASGQAQIATIRNVPFTAQQIWFDRLAFAVINRAGLFRPSQSKEGFSG